MNRGDDLIFSFTATIEQVATNRGQIHWLRCRSLNGLLMHLAAEHYNYLDAEQVADDLWRVSFAARLVYEIKDGDELVGFRISGKSGRRVDVRYDRLPDLCFTDLVDVVERRTA